MEEVQQEPRNDVREGNGESEITRVGDIEVVLDCEMCGFVSNVYIGLNGAENDKCRVQYEGKISIVVFFFPRCCSNQEVMIVFS